MQKQDKEPLETNEPTIEQRSQILHALLDAYQHIGATRVPAFVFPEEKIEKMLDVLFAAIDILDVVDLGDDKQ